MAITNAQQYQQLVNKPADGKRPGYRGIGGYQSGRSAPSSSSRSTSSRSTAGPGDTGGEGGNRPSDQSDRQYRSDAPPVDKSSDLQTINQLKNQNRYVAEDEDLLPGDTLTTEDIKLNKREQEFKNFLDRRNKVNLFGASKLFTGPAQAFSDFNASINRPFFEKVIRAGKIPGLSFDATEEEFEKAYQEYMANRLAGKTDAYGNPMAGFSYGDDGMLTGNFMDNGGGDNNYIPPVIPEDDTTEEDPKQILASRIIGSQFDPTFFAAEGGMAEENNPVGGIMDLESGRQMYFLGKLVKKAGRALKKITKSPIGKAAILGGLAYFGGGGGLPKFLSGKGLGGFSMETLFSKKNPLLFTDGKLSLGKLSLASSAAPFLFPEEEDNKFDLDAYYAANKLDPNAPLNRRIAGSDFYAADGGLMRLGYQEGGDAEPVAKKTMPLLDMDGKEKDYRETGGFVDMGRMERADDVPARLSKNEFVFTADAVRNAGEGDIDKGAEVMYNMMKNLESGGEVSEESQGLEGAREMFQTSQRLGEVI